MSESTAEKKEENPFWRSSCLCFKTTWGHSPCEGGQRQRGSFAPQKAGGGGGGGERLHSWAAANAKTARWLLYIHTLTYAHTILHLQPLAEGDKQVRCPTRATSIPTLFFFYSLFLTSLHQSVQNHCNIHTHADRICHSERCSNLAAGKLQKLSQILTEGKKTQAWAGCLQCLRDRERERKESYSSAFLIGLLWQPIGGQAALTAANQKKGPASQCCCSPKQWQLALMTVSAWSSDGDSRAHTLTYKYMHAHIDTHTWE